MSKKEFERIVASIDERLDKDDIKGAYDTAYANRNDLFDYDAPYTITLLVQLAIEQVDFDLAEKTLEELENFPYVNQQTEETLRDMKKHIKDEMKSFYSRNRVKGYLPYSESLSDELISSYLQDKDFCNSPYAIPFAVSLVEDIKRDGKTKTGGLILLIERKYDKEVYLKKNGEPTYTWDAADRVPCGVSLPKYRGNIAHLIVHAVTNRIDMQLEEQTGHSMELRRYYRKVQY